MGCTIEWQVDSIRVQGGALRGIEVDMSEISDTVQTLAVVALFAEGETTSAELNIIALKRRTEFLICS